MLTKIIDPKTLLAKLKKADEAYFNSDKPIMSDKEYDKLREQLTKAKIPDAALRTAVKKYLAGTGIADSNSGAKVALPFYHASLDKMKTDSPKDIPAFLKRFSKPTTLQFVTTPKADGSSLSLRYSKGKFVSARSRGDGTVGRDVTLHAQQFVKAGIIPATIDAKGDVYVRCEIFITRKAFKRWQGKKVGNSVLQEARNAVNGVLTGKGKNFNMDFIRDLSVVALDITDKNGSAIFDTKLQAIKAGAAWGFNDVLARHAKLVSGGEEKIQAALRAALEKVSDKKFELECDGVVIEVNRSTERAALRHGREDRRPYYAMAYKYGVTDDSTAQDTTVKLVFWTKGADGANIPNVEYEPIMVGKTQLTNASMHNAKALVDMNVQAGSVIKVVRSGGVIPHVVSVVKQPKKAGPTPLPTKCSCGARLEMDGPNLYCTKPDKCPDTIASRFDSAIKYLELDGLGAVGVAALVKAGITTLPQLVKVSEKKFVAMFKEAAGKRVYKSVQKFANQESDWYVLMVASGVFVRRGFALGETRSKKFIKALNLESATLAKFEAFAENPNLLAKKLKDVKDMGPEVVMLLGLGMPQFIKFVKALG